MQTAHRTTVTVETTIQFPVEKVWKYWTEPGHITKWCQASDDWHAPYADNDVRIGGTFKTTMAAKDGSFSFDFGGVYTDIKPHHRMAYTMGDGRMVEVLFKEEGNTTRLTEIFETEDTHPIDVQRGGWQAILDNFKKHVEEN